MFTLAISCLITSNLPWLMDLTFQVSMQYCSLKHWTLPWLPGTFTTKHCFYFVPGFLFFLELFLTCLQWRIEHLLTLGVHLPLTYLFAFSYCSWDSQSKNTGVVCHSLLWWTTFSQNSPLWPIHFGWLCISWLIASLNYTSPFATTRLCSMKRE